jgi:hypothetical protein
VGVRQVVACDQSDEMDNRIARNALTFVLTAKATLESNKPAEKREERQKSDDPCRKRLARKKEFQNRSL